MKYYTILIFQGISQCILCSAGDPPTQRQNTEGVVWEGMSLYCLLESTTYSLHSCKEQNSKVPENLVNMESWQDGKKKNTIVMY